MSAITDLPARLKADAIRNFGVHDEPNWCDCGCHLSDHNFYGCKTKGCECSAFEPVPRP
jgi:hypothetical protein